MVTISAKAGTVVHALTPAANQPSINSHAINKLAAMIKVEWIISGMRVLEL